MTKITIITLQDKPLKKRGTKGKKGKGKEKKGKGESEKDKKGNKIKNKRYVWCAKKGNFFVKIGFKRSFSNRTWAALQIGHGKAFDGTI